MTISKLNGVAVNDASTIMGASTFSKIEGVALEASIPNSLFNIWYDGDNVIESAGAISDLIDIGTDGNDATQTTGGNKPAYTSSNSTFNNEATIDPAGNDFMTLDSSFSLDLDSNWTAFFVGVMTGTYWSMWESSSASAYMWEQLSATGSSFRDGTTLRTATSANFTTANIWMYYGDGTNVYVYNGSDGSENSVNVTAASVTITMDTIFRRNTAAVYATGEMAMTSINYGTNLSDSNKNAVGSYLSSKYGLTWTSI